MYDVQSYYFFTLLMFPGACGGNSGSQETAQRV